MRTAEQQPARRLLCRMIAGFVPVALFAAGAPAFGHAILISRGVVVAHADRLAVELEVSAEDFFHYYRIRSDENTVAVADVKAAVERHKVYLLDRFSIRNEAGDRLSGRVVSVKAELPPDERMPFLTLRTIHVTYQLEYPLEKPERFLTFQQRFGDDATVLPSQLVLSVQRAGSEHGRLVQLTNGGNFETVDLNAGEDRSEAVGDPNSGPDGTPPPERAMGADRFREVFAFIRRKDDGYLVDAYIPIALFETFVPFKRRDADFLSRDELRAARHAILHFLEDHPLFRVETRQATGSNRVVCKRIAFLQPSELRISDCNGLPDRMGAWSGRVGIQFRCSCAGQDSLVWMFFNSSLMNATVWQVTDGRCGSEESVMPGDDTIRLNALESRP